MNIIFPMLWQALDLWMFKLSSKKLIFLKFLVKTGIYKDYHYLYLVSKKDNL